jgi:hypothetical protein
MGWDFVTDATKADVIREKVAGWEGPSGKTVCLRHCLKGNILWTVMETTYSGDFLAKTVDTPPVERWIGCTILGVEKGVGWGSKDMSESMGPCFYSVPLAYLDLVPEPGGLYAAGWRDKVRAYHAARARTVKIGETVKLYGTAINEVVIESLRPLRGRAVGGTLYRIPRRMLVPAGLR